MICIRESWLMVKDEKNFEEISYEKFGEKT